MGNAGSRYQEELLPMESFGNAVQEHFSFHRGSSRLRLADIIGGKEKIMRLIKKLECHFQLDVSRWICYEK